MSVEPEILEESPFPFLSENRREPDVVSSDIIDAYDFLRWDDLGVSYPLINEVVSHVHFCSYFSGCWDVGVRALTGKSNLFDWLVSLRAGEEYAVRAYECFVEDYSGL